MKKENVYVKVSTEKEAKNYRKILKQLGEPISDIYFANFEPSTDSHCNLVFCLDGNWTMGAVKKGEKISFGQLIDLLNEPQKIAVRVENEKEFNALMKYYDSLGYVWNGGQRPTEKETLRAYPNVIGFEDKFQHSIEDLKEWDLIIPFSDFAKEYNIKLPLLKSEDGVWLYEGDKYTVGYRETEFTKWIKGDDNILLENDNLCLSMPDVSKAFSTKQAALDWIEAQKPKRNYLSGGQVYFEIQDNSIKFFSKSKERTHAIHFLTKLDLDLINTTMQELS